MREIRWAFSFFLALLIHGMVLAGLFFWHPGFRSSIVYSPSFSVGLYARIPRGPGPPKPREVKAKVPRVRLKPQAKPRTPPSRARKVEKKAWKVKEKKPVKKARKRARPVKKVTRARKVRKVSRRASRRAAARREKALLARALAKVSKEVSMGGGGVSREAVELKYKEYYDEIWRRVKASWILPEEVVSGGEDLLTVVVIRIGRGGELLKMELEESSGNKIYDQSCLRAVKKAAPFPPLPKDYPQKYMELGLRFRPWE